MIRLFLICFVFAALMIPGLVITMGAAWGIGVPDITLMDAGHWWQLLGGVAVLGLVLAFFSIFNAALSDNLNNPLRRLK